MTVTKTFTSTSTDSDGFIVSSSWSFGDGSVASGTTVEHVFPIKDGPGSVVTVAGRGGYSGYSGTFSGDGGLATAADIRDPWDVAVDSAGNVYIADTYNHRIRKVTASTGIITTIAGTGVSGFSGDGGAATSAKLDRPSGICVDSAGNVYVGDYYNRRIRKIDAVTGIITTYAGGGASGGTNGIPGPATSAYLGYPRQVRMDASGNLYIHSTSYNQLLKVTAATGQISLLAGTSSGGTTPANGVAGTAANLDSWISGLAVDSAGAYVYMATDSGGSAPNRVLKLNTSTGLLSIIAGTGATGYSGDGGPATSAKFWSNYGVAVDSQGAVYVSEHANGAIRKILPNGNIKTIAGVHSDGLYGHVEIGFNYDDPNGGNQAVNTALSNPIGICIAPDGDLYVANMGADRILRMPQRSEWDVTLTVTDNDGASDTYTDTVSVDIDDWPLHNSSAASIVSSAVCWWSCATGVDSVSAPPEYYEEAYRASVPNSISGAPKLYGGGGYGQTPGGYNIVAGTAYATPFDNYLYVSTGLETRTSIAALATSNWTIGGKFRVPEMGQDDSFTFFAYRKNSGEDTIAVIAHGNGTMSVRLNGGEVELTTPSAAYESDTFFEAGVTYNGSALRLYVDSSIAAQKSVAATLDAGDYLYLPGPSMWQVFVCNAALDDAAMAYVNGRQYSRILTDSTA